MKRKKLVIYHSFDSLQSSFSFLSDVPQLFICLLTHSGPFISEAALLAFQYNSTNQNLLFSTSHNLQLSYKTIHMAEILKNQIII
jgi:hypothetical protein